MHAGKIIAAIASRKFFYGSVVFLVFQAAWIALTARYPQAFDEQVHFGISQLYAHQWSPFFTDQPITADRFGTLTADPSFLYHYLLSFPYRVLSLVTHSLTAQVIVLRFVNIWLFAWGLVVFRKLLLETPASRALTHATLLFFVLIPVVPLLASQINYDNLLMPLVGLSLLWMVRLIKAWQSTQVFPFEQALRLLILCLFTATIKYPFLPIFAALALIGLGMLWRHRHGLLASCWTQARAMSRLRIGVYASLLLIAMVLCAGSYGRNLLRYHTPLPSCEKVLSVQRCMAYSPWARDYQFSHNSDPKPSPQSIRQYTDIWMKQSMDELLFTISSNFGPDGVTVEYHPTEPLPVLKQLAWIVFWSGLALGMLFFRRLWRIVLFQVSLAAGVLYVGALWLKNYQDYLSTGYPVAVHGRYLLPLLPVLLIAIGLCYSWLLQGLQKIAPKLAGPTVLVVVATALLLQGGGFISYIVRSDPTWFWNPDAKASHLNGAAKKVLQPVVIGD